MTKKHATVADVKDAARWLAVIADTLPDDLKDRAERAADLHARSKRLYHLARHFGRMRGEYFEASLDLFKGKRRRSLIQRVVPDA